MESYNKFRQELELRARAASDAYALAYVEKILKNLVLTVPGVEHQLETETQWLKDFNIRDGLHHQTAVTQAEN